jgi:hypothetical protein
MPKRLELLAVWTPWTRWKKFHFHRSRRRQLLAGDMELARLVQREPLPVKLHNMDEFIRREEVRRWPFVVLSSGSTRVLVKTQDEVQALTVARVKFGAK